LKNGKVTNNDRISKRSVAAIFPHQATAGAAVGKLMETEFAIIAWEVLVNAGGDTNTNQPEQLAAQAETMHALPRESA
jgi:hypothetical protein